VRGTNVRGTNVRGKRAETTIASMPQGRRYIVESLRRPAGAGPASWDTTVSRLEELGVMPGETVEKVGTLSPAGPVVVRVLGSKVALSKDVADLVIVRPAPKC